MTKNDIGQFVNDLLTKTQSGKLTWKETGDENAFRVTLKNGMIRVEYSLVASMGDDYCLVILDKENKEVERVYAKELESMPFQLNELWNAARRTALNADDVVKSLWEEINSVR